LAPPRAFQRLGSFRSATRARPDRAHGRAPHHDGFPLSDPRASFGKAGERLALVHYRLRGYRLLGRRVRTEAGEVDLVLRRGRTLVVVEVKRRHRADGETRWLSRRQETRVRAAAARLRGDAGWARTVRVDLVTIEGWRVTVWRDI
jgi:putative endonuclease